ncbi:hypothetical protein IAR55_000196 [Kwoniella newhampshirensis]|uniref:Uncharacterized protein n=1 Tax=Kwoniella newhampshirensis TaxID=1651941 RepID=A0AAW0Z653_9TREE
MSDSYNSNTDPNTTGHGSRQSQDQSRKGGQFWTDYVSRIPPEEMNKMTSNAFRKIYSNGATHENDSSVPRTGASQEWGTISGLTPEQQVVVAKEVMENFAALADQRATPTSANASEARSRGATGERAGLRSGDNTSNASSKRSGDGGESKP